MTEEQLKARGYPGGDAQLLERYVQHFGAAPAWPIFEPPPDWKREILYNALAMEVAARKSEGLGAAIGPWQPGEPTGVTPQRRRRRRRK